MLVQSVNRAEDHGKKDNSRKDKIVYHAFIIRSCAAKRIDLIRKITHAKAQKKSEGKKIRR